MESKKNRTVPEPLVKSVPALLPTVVNLLFAPVVGLVYGFVPILGILLLDGGFKLDLAGLETGGKSIVSFSGGISTPGESGISLSSGMDVGRSCSED
jgi:hypothetical protein